MKIIQDNAYKYNTKWYDETKIQWLILSNGVDPPIVTVTLMLRSISTLMLLALKWGLKKKGKIKIKRRINRKGH